VTLLGACDAIQNGDQDAWLLSCFLLQIKNGDDKTAG